MKKKRLFTIFQKLGFCHHSVDPGVPGLQQKKGAEKSITKWLFFLHADTELSQVNIEQIEKFVRSNKNKVAFFNLIYDEAIQHIPKCRESRKLREEMT